jgi:hypothetical protein
MLGRYVRTVDCGRLQPRRSNDDEKIMGNEKDDDASFMYLCTYNDHCE